MQKKYFYAILIVFIFLLGGYFLLGKNSGKNLPQPVEQVNPTPKVASEETVPVEVIDSKDKEVVPAPVSSAKLTLAKAPFVLQAPFGNWEDPIFQNACEETSIVMAVNWLAGIQSVSSGDAQKQILDIVKFENETFGYNADTDVFDMQKIFQQFFHKQNVSVRENISLDNIKDEIQKGNLVLVPAFGQALGNPNYTAPGPIAHMLVIIGYDSETRQFITNDSGTRRGAGYRYDEKVLFGAIWEYSSGNGPLDPPAKGAFKKAMIVVSPD